MRRLGLIVTSATTIDLTYFSPDKFYIVGVERGCLELMRQGIVMDYAIADFDQVTKQELEQIQSVAKETIVLERDKDELDGIVAIKLLLTLGVEQIKFLTQPTQRYDMDFSVLDLLNEYPVEVFNEKSHLYRIEAGIHELNYEESRYISFFTLEDHNYISLKNLKFEVDNLECRLFSSRFISNEFLPGINPTVDVEHPVVVVITK